jgi:predicted DNA repair protein MutK
MPTLMRILGSVLLFGGLAIGVAAALGAVGDEGFFKAREALERHPEHMLFQAEYYRALARHLGLIATSAIAFLFGTVGGAVVLGLHAVLRRLERLEAAVDAATRAR